MISRTLGRSGERAGARLALAASPTFALMAWVSAAEPAAAALCSPAARILPLDGMTAMYLLMSLFHLSPWLKLAGQERAA